MACILFHSYQILFHPVFYSHYPLHNPLLIPGRPTSIVFLLPGILLICVYFQDFFLFISQKQHFAAKMVL